MNKVVIGSHADFEAFLGREIGKSTWLKIEQPRINQFADATLDHQWIHIDSERAATSAFGSTIAHGYLTLSLVPYLWEEIAILQNLKMQINYGIESLRFNQAVTVGSEVRLVVKLSNLLNLRGITKAELDVVLEIKDQPKPAFTGTLVFLYHFEK